jgi:hypothetical protein
VPFSQSTNARALPRITIVFKPPKQAPRIFSIASKEACKPPEQRSCFLRRLFCPARAETCITAESVGETVSAEGGVQQTHFRFPDTGAAGPVTIAVTSFDKPPPDKLLTQTCNQFVTAEHRPDLTLCIDRFQPLPGDDPPGDPTFAELVALPSSYDYSAECTYSVGKPPCLGKAKDIAYTLNSEGDVLMSVRWANILRLKAKPDDYYQRELLASTAVEALQGQGNRIVIPSAVFLETTTQQGGAFSPNPSFVPLDLSTIRPNEQSFSGTADKGKSVLKFARRKLWAYSCNGGANQSQACEPDWAGVDCPSAQCVQSPTATYFACVGGPRNRLPCTRTAHCLNGTCQPLSQTTNVCVLFDGTQTGTTCKKEDDCTPRCQPVSTAGAAKVCVEFDGTPTGTPCTVDSDCVATAECGPGLFEFRDRVTNGVGALTRIATGVRGVCDSGPQFGAVCTQSSTCGGGNCVTYRASALKYTTPIPGASP